MEQVPTNEQREGREVLRQARAKKKWTQQHVADLLGVDLQTIGAWERGNRIPTHLHKIRWAGIFNIDPRTLFFERVGVDVEQVNTFQPYEPTTSRQRDSPMTERKEYPNTYFVQDRSSRQELDRLRIQDQMLTTSMGGVLPEQDDPSLFHRVLDVGCGTGGWLIEVAKTYPHLTTLVGVDVSKRMLDYARTQAAEHGVADRIEFHVMDALRMLEFPQGYFDLINQRLGVSYLRTWDWPNLLQEYQRVTRRGGVIRITESDIAHGNSPALMRLSNLVLQASHFAGHLPQPEMAALSQMLAPTLHQQGIDDVHTRVHTLEFPAATKQGQLFIEDLHTFYRVAIPFLEKWIRLPGDYDATYQQMYDEIQQPTFVGRWNFLTLWGNPSKIRM